MDPFICFNSQFPKMGLWSTQLGPGVTIWFNQEGPEGRVMLYKHDHCDDTALWERAVSWGFNHLRLDRYLKSCLVLMNEARSQLSHSQWDKSSKKEENRWWCHQYYDVIIYDDVMLRRSHGFSALIWFSLNSRATFKLEWKELIFMEHLYVRWTTVTHPGYIPKHPGRSCLFHTVNKELTVT